jgi:hypothetical protein
MTLAREIAMDVMPLEKILELHQVSEKQFRAISKLASFKTYLEEQLRVWHGTLNTQERVRVKFLAAVEMAMPEMFARMHDENAPLTAKSDLFKAFQKGAGIGERELKEGAAGEKVQITINLGDVKPVSVEAHKTIEGTATEL